MKIASAFPGMIMILSLCMASCWQAPDKHITTDEIRRRDSIAVSDSIAAVIKAAADTVTDIEKELIAAGLVDIHTLDTGIRVDLKYASTDNFMKANIYGNLHKAFFQPDVAMKIVKAQQNLKVLHPAYNLIIYDAARPRKFQKALWDSLKVPAYQKGHFVSNPKNGSVHNFGAAVDLCIVDEKGMPLDMGCSFDTNEEIAWPSAEYRMLASGQLSQQQIDNRKLLRQVMRDAGFYNIQTEWWHFNACTRDAAWARYKIIE